METLAYNDMSWSVDHAVKGSNYVRGYASDGRLIIAIDETSDFNNIEYDGIYLTPDECLTDSCNEVLHVGGKLIRRDGAEVDFTEQIKTIVNDVIEEALGGDY